MVWPRKRRTHQIWYTGARLTVRRKDKAGAKPSAPCKALKTHKMRKKSRPGAIPRRRRIVAALAERGGRRAPHFPSVNQAELTRSATASTALAQPRGDREENYPPCNPLKNHKTGKNRVPNGPASYPFVPAILAISRITASAPSSRSASSSQSPTITIRMSGRTRAGKPCTVAHFTNPVGFGERVAARRQRRRKSSSVDGELVFRGRVAAARQYALLCARGETTVSRMIFKSNHSDQLST